MCITGTDGQRRSEEASPNLLRRNCTLGKYQQHIFTQSSKQPSCLITIKFAGERMVGGWGSSIKCFYIAFQVKHMAFGLRGREERENTGC